MMTTTQCRLLIKLAWSNILDGLSSRSVLFIKNSLRLQLRILKLKLILALSLCEMKSELAIKFDLCYEVIDHSLHEYFLQLVMSHLITHCKGFHKRVGYLFRQFYFIMIHAVHLYICVA